MYLNKKANCCYSGYLMFSNIPVSNLCGARILDMEIISIIFCSKGDLLIVNGFLIRLLIIVF